jgi:hypothetical protein
MGSFWSSISQFFNLQFWNRQKWLLFAVVRSWISQFLFNSWLILNMSNLSYRMVVFLWFLIASYESLTLLGLGVSLCRHASVSDTNTYNYIELHYFFKLLLVSKCLCRVSVCALWIVRDNIGEIFEDESTIKWTISTMSWIKFLRSTQWVFNLEKITIGSRKVTKWLSSSG